MVTAHRLTDGENIRDVMAFPKTASGHDPMTDAPDRVEEVQLHELHLQVVMPKDDGGELISPSGSDCYMEM